MKFRQNAHIDYLHTAAIEYVFVSHTLIQSCQMQPSSQAAAALLLLFFAFFYR